MATKTKEGAQGKERRSPSPSTPMNIDIPHAKRTPKSSVTGSPGKDSSILSEKSIPRYLKPTVSSGNESHKPSKKPATNAETTKSLTTRKSFEKPPSPSQTQRTSPSASPKEKPLKSSLPFAKSASSPKPISDKTPKTLRNGKAQPLVKPKSLRKETTSVKKRETKDGPTAATSTATSPNMPDDQEDKAVHEIALEMLKGEGEQAINEIKPIDYVDIEPDIHENNKIEASNSSFPLEENEEAKKTEDCEGDNHQEEKEQGDSDEEHEDSEHPQQFEENPASDGHQQIKEEGGDGDVRICAGNEREKERENAENERTELKERDESSVEDPKTESEKVVPKRQDRRGKKDVPAYNDVIEETASKLVEKRRSKVKALVGAFETVISLQEPEGQGGQ